MTPSVLVDPMRSMRCVRFLVLSLLVLASCPAEEELLYGIPDRESETKRREREGYIATVFYDLRLEQGGAHAGLPPKWPQGFLDLKVEQSHYEWDRNSILVNAPGLPLSPNPQPLREQRTEGSVAYRQSLWTPWPWDAQLECSGSFVDRTSKQGSSSVSSDDLLLGDPRALLLIPVWQERYAGILIGGGCSFPVGDREDWFRAHDRLGYVGTIRGSGLLPGVSFLCFTASADLHVVQGARQEIYPSPARTPVTEDFRSVDLAAKVSLRLTREASLGLAERYERYAFRRIQISGFSGNIDEDVARRTSSVFLTIMGPRTVFTTLTVGNDGSLTKEADYSYSVNFDVALW